MDEVVNSKSMKTERLIRVVTHDFLWYSNAKGNLAEGG